MKKACLYKFIPSKAEEEACESKWAVTRELIETRDIYPSPKIDLKNPRLIKKKITTEEVSAGSLVIPFSETFEYILRYWKLEDAKSLVYGYRTWVKIWDVTEESNPKKYESGIVLKKLPSDDFLLSCVPLFNDQRFDIDDEIGLYWDPRSFTFHFKLFVSK